MKKTILAVCSGILISGAAMAQPVSDRAVIPLGVTLVQILRIHVTNGGNIEFVFNDINDYKQGINNVNGNGFYTSRVEIASSTNWQLDMGAEDANLLGTDNPANVMALNNVGFTCLWGGANVCCGPANDVDNTGAYTDNISAAGAPLRSNALLQYTGTGTVILFTTGATGNGGDVTDNFFDIQWEVGTHDGTWGVPTYPNSATNPMSTNAILNQSLVPDRYVTNVFLELTAL
jgi:hypothetical protein